MELIGKDNCVNKECVTLNIKCLTQYGSTLHGHKTHYERINVKALEVAFYMLSRLYQIELKDTVKMNDEDLELINQSSPGFPYNIEGSVKNVEMADIIKDTLEEMDKINENGKLVFNVYSAFTKLDLMSIRKKHLVRIISSSPAHLSLATQRWSSIFEHNLQQNHRHNAIKIGVGKFYLEYESMRQFLEATNKDLLFNEQDVSGWDHRLFSFLMELFWLFLYQNCFKDIDLKDKRKFAQVVEGQVASFFLTKEGELVSVLGGQKSGSQVTCVLNSWAHLFILAYAFAVFAITVLKMTDLNEIFIMFFQHVRACKLGDDSISVITEYLVNLGFNKEFILMIYTDHFSLIANPEKNKFYKKDITDDIWFLGSKFQEEKNIITGQTVVVPVPKRTRIIDSIVFFRDKYKFSAIVFNTLKSEGVLHELFRLTRVQAALVNSYFDEELRGLLLFLRGVSVAKLGLNENDIESNFGKLSVYSRDLESAITKLAKKTRSYFMFLLLGP